MTKFFSGILTILFSLPVFRFISGSFAEEKQSGWYPIARAQDLTDEVNRVSFTRIIRDGWLSRTSEDYVWVRKDGTGKFTVYEPHCTHLGCAYSWNIEAKQFQCPCHGGKFDINGNRTDGPPPRPLDRFELELKEGTLRIGKVKKV